MATTTPYQWDVQVLKDLGVQPGSGAYNADLNFLNAWQTHETGDVMPNTAHYNLLGNMGRLNGPYGGVPVNNYLGGGGGLLSYPTLEQGAADTAHRISLYGDLSKAFQSGAQLNTNYSGLGTWSGGGYTSLGPGGNPNTAATNPPPGTTNNPAAAAQTGLNKIALERQAVLDVQLAALDEQYARVEADFQNRLLGLQKKSLGISEGGLARQLAEAPALQSDVSKLYYLQYAGISANKADLTRQFKQSQVDLASQGAATGSSFTKGHADELYQMTKDYQSKRASLDRQWQALRAQQNQEAISYLEKIQALQDQKKQYDIASKRYGIQGEEIATRLMYSIAQTGAGVGVDIQSLEAQSAMNEYNFLSALGSPNIVPMTQGAPGSVVGSAASPYVGDPLNTMPPNFGQPGAGPY